MSVDWTAAGEYTDIRYEPHGDGIAKITINRPEVRNAFRPADALRAVATPSTRAQDDPTVGVIVLTGEGDLAFCSGGDQRIRGDDGYIGDDAVAKQGIGRLNVLDLQIQIRRCPKPVVAMVAGYAIGGGHVLHVVLRPDDRRRQRALRPDRPEGRLVRRRLRLGPARAPDRPEAREGDLVPLPPVRRARRRSTWGLVNAVVPLERLEEETVQWCREMLALSPLALRMLKASFNAADDGLAGVQQLAGDATLLFYMTDEAQEGRDAYVEKRRPDFSKFPRRP